jgi:hypothetical protein
MDPESLRDQATVLGEELEATAEHAQQFLTVTATTNIEAAKDPDPSLDGIIRWWLPHSYDGLIASHTGDVSFSLWHARGDEQAITPGMPVTWLLGEGQHGKYRKASEVQPAQP